MATVQAFSDELSKIAVSWGHFHVPKSRSGKRPMSVSTLLRKEKDGTLYKHTKKASSGSEQSRVEYQEVDPANPNGKAARAKDKKGDAPDREAGGNAVKVEARQDMRSSNIAVAQGEKFNAPEGYQGY